MSPNARGAGLGLGHWWLQSRWPQIRFDVFATTAIYAQGTAGGRRKAVILAVEVAVGGIPAFCNPMVQGSKPERGIKSNGALSVSKHAPTREAHLARLVRLRRRSAYLAGALPPTVTKP
jgi:hypothetical protein